MNKLSTEQRVRVVQALVEGVSINATTRMTGVSKPTILKLLKDLGCACAAYHHKHVRGLKPTSIQCDELWAFVGAKQKNAKPEKRAQGWGDAWTWTAIDPDTKLIMSYHLGLRTPDDARAFMMDLSERINNITQLTTDGLGSYTIRMSMRRFTRLTNGHSKKIENHGHALALFFMHYNYCRKHSSLKGATPAMATGLADQPWSVEELIGLID